MKTKTYDTKYGTITVKECTLKEFVDVAAEMLDYFVWADSLGIVTGGSLLIEYNDGSTCSFFDGYGKKGKFKSSRISFGVIDNGSTYMVTGKYTIDSNGILDRA